MGFSNLELEGKGGGIIMGVTRLLLLGQFYTIQIQFYVLLCTRLYVLYEWSQRQSEDESDIDTPLIRRENTPSKTNWDEEDHHTPGKFSSWDVPTPGSSRREVNMVLNCVWLD